RRGTLRFQSRHALLLGRGPGPSGRRSGLRLAAVDLPAPVPGARAAAPPAGRPGHASPHGAAGTAVSTACPRTHVPRGSAVTAATHGGGGLGRRTDARHAQQHFRFVLLDRLPVTGRPGITRAGTA